MTRRTSSRRRLPSRKESETEGGGGGASSDLPQTDPPPVTESARQRIPAEIENLKNAKSDNAIAVTVGQEIETKKHGYVIVREIMKGKYSRVYEVRRNRDQKILAMKAQFQSDNNTVSHGKGAMLRHEAHIYHELSQLSRKVPRDEIRFLNIYDYGECGEGQFLFITLASETLANVLSDEKVPSHQTALDLSYQMFNAIEQIHQLGFIHCRIRPNTFVTGIRSRERYTLFLINFSLARMANPSRTDSPVINRTAPQVFDRYAPRCQHHGHPYHRRDDLESWFYISCDFFHPLFLPWSADKRLKSAYMAELKDKLMKGELFHRYSVMPKPFQAIAGAINETDGKMPNYSFFKECLLEEAKTKNCSFNIPWEYIPVASLPPIVESQSMTRIEFEFNQCVKNPATFNFGAEKSRAILPDNENAGAAASSDATTPSTSDVQIVLPKSKSSRDSGKKVVSEKAKESSSATSESGLSSSADGKGKTESIICSMSDAVKNSAAASETDTKASTPPSSKPINNNNNNVVDKLPNDASSEDDDDEEEEEFKLRSPPTGTLQKSKGKPSPSKTTPSTTTSTAATSSSGTESGTSASETSDGSSATTTSATASTSSGSSITSTAKPGDFGKKPAILSSASPATSSASSSSSSGSSDVAGKQREMKGAEIGYLAKSPRNSRRIIAAVNSGSPNPSSTAAASPKQNSIPTSNCSTASLPANAKSSSKSLKKKTTTTNNDSVYYNPSNAALNNYTPSYECYGKSSSSPSTAKASQSSSTTTGNSTSKNQSVYFAPK